VPKKIVRWTLDEQQQVATQAAKVRIEQGLGELEAWRIGQQILPVQRRRRIGTVSLIAPSAREYYRKQLQEQQKKPKDEAPPELPLAAAVPASLPTTFTLVDDLLEALADAVAEKFVDALRRRIIQRVREESPTLVKSIQTEPVESKQPKRSLLVVGLLPAQAETIRKRFADRLDLRFVSSQETPQLIAARLGNSEKVLLMTNFINHSHQNTAMQLKGRENVLLVSGGVSSLTKELDRL
jgi:hypothetical protein